MRIKDVNYGLLFMGGAGGKYISAKVRRQGKLILLDYGFSDLYICGSADKEAAERRLVKTLATHNLKIKGKYGKSWELKVIS